jgi:hypothetical protein
MSVIDDFVRYGTLEISKESGVTKVVFTGKPFMDGVPARLVVMENDAQDALLKLWNTLVGELPMGFPNHRKENR